MSASPLRFRVDEAIDGLALSPSRVPSFSIVRAVSGRLPRKSCDMVAWSIARNLANARSEYCGFLAAAAELSLQERAESNSPRLAGWGRKQVCFHAVTVSESAFRRQYLHMKTGAMQLHQHAICVAAILRSSGTYFNDHNFM